MLQIVQQRRRPKKRLSFADSVRLLRSVKEYLPDDPYGRTAKLATILGCDRRTARRLLNSKEDELPCLRKAYLDSAVSFTGASATALLSWRADMPEIQRRLLILQQSELPRLDRFREMSAMASSMAARCIFGYEMPASFTVECDTHLEPMAMRVRFRKNSSLADIHEVAIIRDDYFGWRMVYNHDELGERFKGVINDANFERLLHFIKHQSNA